MRGCVGIRRILGTTDSYGAHEATCVRTVDWLTLYTIIAAENWQCAAAKANAVTQQDISDADTADGLARGPGNRAQAFHVNRFDYTHISTSGVSNHNNKSELVAS